jgi:hypothetical protein
VVECVDDAGVGGGGDAGDEFARPVANPSIVAYAVAVGGRFSGSLASACKIANDVPAGASGRFAHGSGGSTLRCALASSNIDLSEKGARPEVHS